MVTRSKTGTKLDRVPRLSAGCRLSTKEKEMLLVPEAIIQVGATGFEILSLCDGVRSLSDIITALIGKFPSAPPDKISRETVEFLEQLAVRGSITFQ